MKTRHFFTVLFLMVVFIQSCKKEDVTIKKESITANQTDIAQVKFAKILAPALANSQELRELVKAEALKQFDKDYDVLYQLIRDQKVGNQTVSDLLSSYAESKEDFASIENSLPLLNILIPTVPNFTPENWDVNTEVPMVAVALSEKKEVPMYDKDGNKTIIPSGCIPGFPVVVVKQNERVVVTQSGALKSSKNVNNGYAFNFVDKSFDGTALSLKRLSKYSGIDLVNIEAYKLRMPWHRDYVYYGLTPTNTTGTYRHNYSEYITNFMFLDGMAGYNKISDQTDDPRIALVTSSPGNWTDGSFEFKITVVVNAKNGVGSVINKFFPAKISELFNVNYTFVTTIGSPGLYLDIYKVSSLSIKLFNPNLELIPWDLENYGNAWKFIISEFDVSEEITTSYENTTTYAGNFTVPTTKIGLGFGGTATSSQKTTYSIKATRNSDELGEAVLTFDQPIVIGRMLDYYVTKEISTGWVSISVEPRKIFD